MGKKAVFVKARQQDFRRRKAQRQQRSEGERAKRRGTSDTTRRIAHVYALRAMPEEASKKMVLSQFDQACRLPEASDALCTIIRHAGATAEAKEAKAGTEVSRKRPREEASNAASNEADLTMCVNAMVAMKEAASDTTGERGVALDDVISDECGCRVTCQLVQAVNQTAHPLAGKLNTILIDCFEEDETLVRHYVACRILTSIVTHATDKKTKERVLGILQRLCSDVENDGTVKMCVDMMKDRHTAVILQRLLTGDLQGETALWIGQLLGLTGGSDKSSKAGPKGSKRAAAETAEANGSVITGDMLLEVAEDPVSSGVLRGMIGLVPRWRFLDLLPADVLMTSKRGVKLLGELLTFPAEVDESSKAKLEEEVGSLLDKLVLQPSGAGGLNISELCTDKKANFVVQRLMELVPRAGSKKDVLFAHVLDQLSPQLEELSQHGIGVHVLVCLIGVAGQVSCQALDKVFSSIVNAKNTFELVRDRHGSLVVRKFLDAYSNHRQGKGVQILVTVIEQHASALMCDPMGNLVVQEMLKALGTPAAVSFCKRYVKDSAELSRLSQHASAAHVIDLLFTLVDAPTRSQLCASIRPHAVVLAQHVNGRYVVEKAIPESREIRETLLRQFQTLATSKGTQHVLVTLVSQLDAQAKSTLLNGTIIPHIRDYATHENASIVLQKLMQSDETVLKTIAKALSSNPTLAQNMAQNFYGKFVVQIAQNASI